MRAPGLEQLRQRVLAAYHLKPLSDKEVETYIKHRLSKVGWRDDPKIDSDVYFSVYRFTGGVPRRINTLFDRVLLNCSLEESHTICVRDIELVADEIEQERNDGSEFDESQAADSADTPPRPKQPEPLVNVEAEAAKQEVKKLLARMEAMQRTIDLLSERLDAPPPAPIEKSSMFSGDGSRRATVLSILLALGVVGIGMAGAVVYRLLT
jgi:hypothetical protein